MKRTARSNTHGLGLACVALLVASSAIGGCNAIFGIEVKGALPVGDGGGAQGGAGQGGAGLVGEGGVSSNQGGGGSGGGGGSECDVAVEVCGDAIDQDCDGVPDNGCVVGTYVSDLIGSDTNPGTMDWPVKTIGKAINNAAQLQLGTVIVGEGNYAEVVTLARNLSITGGHRCNDQVCDWSYDNEAYVSIIDPPGNLAVNAGPTVDRNSTLRGFLILGATQMDKPAGTYATVDLEHATPTLTENFIEGGEVSCVAYCTVAAVWVHGSQVDPGGPLITGNFISGGASNFETAGVLSHGTADVRFNTVSGGEAQRSAGIRMWVSDDAGALGLIENNTVGAGRCVGDGATTTGISAGGDVAVAGIVVSGNEVNMHNVIKGNCATCGSGLSCGGAEVAGGNVTMVNNIIRGIEDAPLSHGLLIFNDEGSTLGEVIINSNTLLGGGYAGGTASAAIRMRLATGTDATAGRIRNNILDGGDGPSKFGIFEEQTAARALTPSHVEFNQFQDVTMAWSRWNGSIGTMVTTVDDVNAEAEAQGNVAVNCLLNAMFRLQAGSECVDMGGTADVPDDDIDGDLRPFNNSFDIGADEWVP